MRTHALLGIGLIVLGTAATVRAQEVTWRPAAPVSLGTPKPLSGFAPVEAPVRVARGQVGDPPPPPVFPGASGPTVFPAPGADSYNKGIVNNDADLGGFWSRCGDRLRRCWDDVSGGVGGAFQGSSQRQPFQSDHCFDYFISPMTNPFFFEDPRSLTEVRPFFIWQHPSSNNPIWNGGNNFDYGIRGSVALTEHISIVVSRLGFTTIAPRSNALDISSHTGFSEFMIGPKLTFLRNDASRTVAAVGLTFDFPSGSSGNLENTGHLMLIPYFTIAQNFGRTSAGSFNFMNTTGYTFRTDNTRTEAFYSSFHIDYDWRDSHRFYPLLELNWRCYTRNGGARPLSFEGNDLANFGSQFIAGQNELNLAVGTRVVINRNVTWGLGLEFNLLNNTTGQHMDQFRLTTDVIIRY